MRHNEDQLGFKVVQRSTKLVVELCIYIKLSLHRKQVQMYNDHKSTDAKKINMNKLYFGVQHVNGDYLLLLLLLLLLVYYMFWF